VFYSLEQLRYMYKRLAGCLLLITAASAWVTLEVFKQAYYYEAEFMTHHVLPNSETTYGWSFNLIIPVLIMYIVDGIIVLACSRKRKGMKARSIKEARENEPVYLGRM